MSYQVTFTESNNPAKQPITVQDQTLNDQTSLTFVGKNYAGYAPIVAGDFLHLLENFAAPTAPTNPIQGQLWYDNATGVNLLKIYDGTTWNAAGSVKKAGSAPLVANSTAGDLWVDTGNSQLYIFSGSNWLLVGPQFSQGTLTGPNIEIITDTSNNTHNVLSLYSNNNRIAIVSKDTFTPKATTTGFTTINEGITLSSVDSTNATNPSRFWGTASSADALLINNTAVESSNFLRSDQISTSNYALNVRNDGGISIGSTLNFNISTNGSSTILYNRNSGGNISFQLNNAGASSTTLYLDPTAKIGIGLNNTSPATTLDVLGIITASGTSGGLTVAGTADVGAIGGASIQTAGGLTVAMSATVGDDLTLAGQLIVNNLNSNGNPIAGVVITPGSDSATNLYDIGSSTRSFRNIYAQSFVGTFNGSFTGSLAGSISGSAAKLASPTVFSLVGDVTSNAVSFDGQTETGTAIFTTSVNQGIITSQTAASDSYLTDQILSFRSGVGLMSMTKQTLLNHIATVPVGCLFPFAGTVVPSGYLLCDGSEVKISDYPSLYSVIGYAYKASVLLIGLGTFALPDMRGRFPLGNDYMYNNIDVPAKDGSGIQVSGGGGEANRVTDITARTLGASSGSQSIAVNLTNLPDHQHTLSDASGSYYALPGNQATGASDPNASVNIQVSTGTATAYGLGRTGSINGSTQTGTAINTMNPYQTINYIIFTGVI
jgi:microcystin-dependent protein